MAEEMAKESFLALEKTGKLQVNYADHIYLTYWLVCTMMYTIPHIPPVPFIKVYDL